MTTPKLSALNGDGQREADLWDEDQGVSCADMREGLESALADSDRVFLFAMKRLPDGGLQLTALGLQRKGPATRITWTEAYGTMMAWLQGWAMKAHIL